MSTLRLLHYIRPSWEGNDGKPSYRRLTAFLFVLLFCFSSMYWTVRGFTSILQIYALIVEILAFLLTAAIVSWTDLKSTAMTIITRKTEATETTTATTVE